MALHSLALEPVSTRLPRHRGVQRGRQGAQGRAAARGVVGLRLRHEHAAHVPQISRRLLARQSGTKQIVSHRRRADRPHHRPRRRVLQLSAGCARRSTPRCREVARCTRDGIRINTFMLDPTQHLRQFVEKLTQLNRGRAFFTTPETLGDYRPGRLPRAAPRADPRPPYRSRRPPGPHRRARRRRRAGRPDRVGLSRRGQSPRLDHRGRSAGGAATDASTVIGVIGSTGSRIVVAEQPGAPGHGSSGAAGWNRARRGPPTRPVRRAARAAGPGHRGRGRAGGGDGPRRRAHGDDRDPPTDRHRRPGTHASATTRRGRPARSPTTTRWWAGPPVLTSASSCSAAQSGTAKPPRSGPRRCENPFSSRRNPKFPFRGPPSAP